jgi:mannose-6-phosphate isomerase-like protein (cupin superfamily)
MARLIRQPTAIDPGGALPKQIAEYFGRVNSATTDLSIALMKSPHGWDEPGQTPEFDEYSVVVKGTLHLSFRDAELDVHAGQAVLVSKGEWVRYSTPGPEGAEYVSVCLPAFSPDTVHRDE